MPAARPLIVECNWKMHKTLAEASRWVRALGAALPGILQGSAGGGAAAPLVELPVCVPFTLLARVAEEARPFPAIAPGAQDCHWEEEGPYTGEVSARQLADAGARYCFAGHSERRRHFGETDADANRKCRALLAQGIRPILAVGEDADTRRRGGTLEALERQLAACLEGLTPGQAGRTVILYEPVWAVGVGATATPEQADEAHRSIRGILRRRFPGGAAAAVQIIYGGSVDAHNVEAILAISDIQGVGVGKASLQVDSFLRVVEACARAAAGRSSAAGRE